MQQIAEDIFRTNGFDPQFAYVGHYVGLSVHDVGDTLSGGPDDDRAGSPTARS